MKDKYTAVWVSHSSIGDYIKCPRAYFLKNVYRDPKTHHKISLMSPPLALGQAVHEVIESLSVLPVEERLRISLLTKLDKPWKKVSGKLGGFDDEAEEEKYLDRAKAMLTRVMENPGPLTQKAVKIRQDLPHYWLSEDDNIILCGKIDWLTYIEESNTVKILDFKTGKSDEDPDSLQLPIYYLLATHCQSRPVSGMSYWYLNRDDAPQDIALPDEKKSYETILELAKRIQLARKLERFVCTRKDGCSACRPLEAIVAGKATYVGINDYKQDLYIL